MLTDLKLAAASEFTKTRFSVGLATFTFTTEVGRNSSIRIWVKFLSHLYCGSGGKAVASRRNLISLFSDRATRHRYGVTVSRSEVGSVAADETKSFSSSDSEKVWHSRKTALSSWRRRTKNAGVLATTKFDSARDVSIHSGIFICILSKTR